jgi:Tfp pilus assembly protein PilV
MTHPVNNDYVASDSSKFLLERAPWGFAKKGKEAFSLVEVTLALGIFVFAGIGLVGLLTVGLQNDQDSKLKLQAATVAEDLFSTRRASPTNDLTTVQLNFPLPPLTTATNNFASATYLSADGQTTDATHARFGFLYKITPSFYSVPTGNTTSGFSSVYMCFYWPAQANATNNAGHYDVTTVIPLP